MIIMVIINEFDFFLVSTYFKYKENEVLDIDYNELVGHVLFMIMLRNNTIGINIYIVRDV